MMDGGVLAIVASARVSVAAGKSASSTVSSASVGGLRTGTSLAAYFYPGVISPAMFILS